MGSLVIPQRLLVEHKIDFRRPCPSTRQRYDLTHCTKVVGRDQRSIQHPTLSNDERSADYPNNYAKLSTRRRSRRWCHFAGFLVSLPLSQVTPIAEFGAAWPGHARAAKKIFGNSRVSSFGSLRRVAVRGQAGGFLGIINSKKPRRNVAGQGEGD